MGIEGPRKVHIPIVFLLQILGVPYFGVSIFRFVSVQAAPFMILLARVESFCSELTH